MKTLFALTLALATLTTTGAETFDTVITGGRVMDPATELDAIRHIGITDGTIKAISKTPLNGKSTINAKGLVVAPGFVDLHQHGQGPEDYPFKAMDGVTTALELEVGTADVDLWYKLRAGKTPINFGVSIGHIPTRISVMGDKPAFLPPANSRGAKQRATPEQLAAIKRKIEHGLSRGAVAVGFGLQYTPEATQWESLEIFRIAAQFDASCHVHMRSKGADTGLNIHTAMHEVIALSAISGAPGHIVHIQSTGNLVTPRLIEMVAAARKNGLDISCEVYPYTAGMTDIKSAIFDDGWQDRAGITYNNLQWVATGERLTKATFDKYRKQGGKVIVHANPENLVRQVVASPHTMIASDGFMGHPRNAGCYSRVLGKYVRENKDLPLMLALKKCALWPAKRLEKCAPAFKKKGRLQVGADADIIIFNAAKIIDQATFKDAAQFSTGIRYTLVHGVPIVKEGNFQKDIFPGKAARGTIR
ncbi:MAG: D-glutamate deacylase [Verrucomicrobiales bacterium]|nr:D-glutamate deacylase [Verrucomicrobiales bacterium]|tara:strand:+ start:7524 stop:8948 length:1425 start_codon:yes stop_codon:yes gene_type:complete